MPIFRIHKASAFLLCLSFASFVMASNHADHHSPHPDPPHGKPHDKLQEEPIRRMLLPSNTVTYQDGDMQTVDSMPNRREISTQTASDPEVVWIQLGIEPIMQYELSFEKIAKRSVGLSEYFRSISLTLTLDALYTNKDLHQIQRDLNFGTPPGTVLSDGARKFLLSLPTRSAKDFQTVHLQSALNRGIGKTAYICTLSVATLETNRFLKQAIYKPDGELRSSYTVPGSDPKSLHLFAYLLFWQKWADPFAVRDQIQNPDTAQSLQPMISAYGLPFPYIKLLNLATLLSMTERDKLPWDKKEDFWNALLDADAYDWVEEYIKREYVNCGPCSAEVTARRQPRFFDSPIGGVQKSIEIPKETITYTSPTPCDLEGSKLHLLKQYEQWRDKVLFHRKGETTLTYFVIRSRADMKKTKNSTLETVKSVYLVFYRK